MGFLRPRETVSTLDEINLDGLIERGIRFVLLDLDNTLGGRHSGRLDDGVEPFLDRAEELGISIGILTNRRRAVEDDAVVLLRARVPLLHNAGKPLRRGYLRLLEQLGGTPNQAAMVGDRILTDIIGANLLGIYAIRIRRSALQENH